MLWRLLSSPALRELRAEFRRVGVSEQDLAERGVEFPPERALAALRTLPEGAGTDAFLASLGGKPPGGEPPVHDGPPGHTPPTVPWRRDRDQGV